MFQAPEVATHFFNKLPIHPHTVLPVILCGGSGTRLWPLSRKLLPKQFVPLIGHKSLLQLTLERVAQLGGAEPGEVLCVAAEAHRYLVVEAMEAAKVSGMVILEPMRRNTAAAMALAALKAQPGQWLLFCLSDHHIPDALTFAAMVEQGKSAAANGAIVSFGIKPSSPEFLRQHRRRGKVSGQANCRETRRSPQPAQPGQDAVGNDRSAVWKLFGRRRHRAL